MAPNWKDTGVKDMPGESFALPSDMEQSQGNNQSLPLRG